jgi:hypothetical protein
LAKIKPNKSVYFEVDSLPELRISQASMASEDVYEDMEMDCPKVTTNIHSPIKKSQVCLKYHHRIYINQIGQGMGLLMKIEWQIPK